MTAIALDVRGSAVDPPRVAVFDYSGAGIAIREDLAAAHRGAWQWIASPGTWWSGPERVAIAEAARRAPSCKLCTERRATLSPLAVSGEHDGDAALPAAAVDAVHRLVTDASRLSKGWLEKTLAGGISDAHYVELLGVVVSLQSVDAFHRAMGLPLEPLPHPLAGEPTRERPACAREGMGWFATIAAKDAVGEYGDLYPKAPVVANVMRAMSLVPDNVRMLKKLSAAQYVPHEIVAKVSAQTGRALSRAQIELIAGRVSALNECFY
jgi:hypothetical protein